MSTTTDGEQPYEVQATSHLHADMFIAAHAALEQAFEMTPQPAHPSLEPRYRLTLGQNMNMCLHNEVERRLGGSVTWLENRGFIAMIPKGLDIAIRLGSCEQHGRPHDTREREEGTPFKNFLEGRPLLFDKCDLIPVFGGYSIVQSKGGGENPREIDRFILAKYERREHVWSWGLDPAEQGRVRSVLDGVASGLEIVPTNVPVARQRRLG